MCQALPGNRCSSHALASLNRNVEKQRNFLRNAKVDSSSELQGADIDKYEAIWRATAYAAQDYSATRSGLDTLTRRIERLSGNDRLKRENAAELSDLIKQRENGKKMRIARRDALKRSQDEVAAGKAEADADSELTLQRIRDLADSYVHPEGMERGSLGFRESKVQYLQQQLANRQKNRASEIAARGRYGRRIVEGIAEDPSKPVDERYYNLYCASARRDRTGEIECQAIGFALVKADPRGDFH